LLVVKCNYQLSTNNYPNMAKIDFHRNERPTVGVELELGLVDAETFALSSAFGLLSARLTADGVHDEEHFKPELMQCVLEINTDICDTVADAERDLRARIATVESACDALGLRLWWGATHPFSRWEEQQITPDDRYLQLVNSLQEMARRLVTFGLHVHVGVDSGDKAIHLCDRLLKHLPALLALSSNSPFFCGRDTGLQSYRSKVIEALPTAGMPTPMRNWSEYVWLINHLINTRFISSNREIWWDVRPHGGFGTVEMRIFDMPLNMRHTMGLVALTQCLVAAISDHIDAGAYQFDSHPMIAKQNKWHAARYGLEASFVDFDTMQAVPAKAMIRRMLERCEPYAHKLGCLPQLRSIEEILEHGTGAQRQRRVFEQTGDLREVVKFLAAQGEMVKV